MVKRCGAGATPPPASVRLCVAPAPQSAPRIPGKFTYGLSFKGDCASPVWHTDCIKKGIENYKPFITKDTTFMNKRIVASFLALACASLILLSGCTKAGMSTSPYGGTYTPPPPSQPNTVSIANMAFGPGSITVSVGTTITWHNNDGINHTSTSNTGVWNTGAIPPGGSKTQTFATAGTFPYHCNIHTMMTGTIIVQ